MKYRIIEYKNKKSDRIFGYRCQIQKSFLGIKYWWTFAYSNYEDFAQTYIEEHKFMRLNPEQKIIHNIDN